MVKRTGKSVAGLREGGRMSKKNTSQEGREIILKAGKMITNRIPVALGLQKLTTEDPEYWGLDALLTDEMAEVVLAMERRKPRTLDEVVKLTGKEKSHVEEILKELSILGIVEYNWENPRHEKQYMVPMFVPGSAEFTNMNTRVLNGTIL